MKAWEARDLLDSIDPNQDVTLTIGRQRPKTQEPWPYQWHVGSPMYRQYPRWVESDYYPPVPFNTITCKTVH